MVKAIGDRLGVEEAQSAELPSLSQDVAPEQVLDHLEHVERTVAREQQGGGAKRREREDRGAKRREQEDRGAKR